jgi:hypothetical protein
LRTLLLPLVLGFASPLSAQTKIIRTDTVLTTKSRSFAIGDTLHLEPVTNSSAVAGTKGVQKSRFVIFADSVVRIEPSPRKLVDPVLAKSLRFALDDLRYRTDLRNQTNKR